MPKPPAEPLTIRLAESDADVDACFEVMRELRTHLDRDEYTKRVRRQSAEGYQIAFLSAGGKVRAAAGFRLIHNLFSGRVLYVDDLVTAAAARSRVYGAALMDWLVERARSLDCDSLELDSGVQRFDSHRFYLARRMHISSHHFRLPLGRAGGPGPTSRAQPGRLKGSS